MIIEHRELIADIDIQELINNDNVINYSQGDTEEAYREAIAIFGRESERVDGEYRIVEVVEIGLDTYLLLLVLPDFDMKEEILGPDKNLHENFMKKMEEFEQQKYSEVDETLFEPYRPSTDPNQIKRIEKIFEQASKSPEIQDDWSY